MVTSGGVTGHSASTETDAPFPVKRRAAIWRRFLGQWGASIGLGWVILLAVAAVFAPLIVSYSPIAQSLHHTFAAPSTAHWLGTDDLGRDVFSRLIYGSRVSLRVSFEVVALALAIAVPVGLFSGYLGGHIDNILMRVMDGGLSFPPLVLALAVVSVLGTGINNTALALAVVFVPAFARLIRGQALAIKEEPFIEASKSLGTPPFLIVARRIFPNVLPAVVIQASFSLGSALLAEAALSFLGLGAQPPSPSWGSMLEEAYNTGLSDHPWSLVVPGVAIASAVLAFNSIGDGLAATVGQRRGRGRRLTRQTSKRGLTRVEQTRSSTARQSVVARPSPAGDRCLVVEGLTVEVVTAHGMTPVVEDVHFFVNSGETLGLVGESGCGKTVISLAIMRLLDSPPFMITGGRVSLKGDDLLSLDFRQMRRSRGRDLSMIFQDPVSSLNPARTVGTQIVESVRLHDGVSRDRAKRLAGELLEKVGISDPNQRLRQYPHQLSGGMRQRIMIAMALSCHPSLLIADEPTTALDVTVQAQILDLLRHLCKAEGLAVIFVTHDLAVVSELCDRVVVMYAGQVVEVAHTKDLFDAPRHPYTEGLIAASRTANNRGLVTAIPGDVPDIGDAPSGCRFHPRCPYAEDRCLERPTTLSPTTSPRTTDPRPLEQGGDGRRLARCLRQEELTLQGIGRVEQYGILRP